MKSGITPGSGQITPSQSQRISSHRRILQAGIPAKLPELPRSKSGRFFGKSQFGSSVYPTGWQGWESCRDQPHLLPPPPRNCVIPGADVIGELRPAAPGTRQIPRHIPRVSHPIPVSSFSASTREERLCLWVGKSTFQPSQILWDSRSWMSRAQSPSQAGPSIFRDHFPGASQVSV